MQILVFKTNISHSGEGTEIRKLLNSYKGIKWNFDHWDIDNILRIESENDCSEDIINLLSMAGHLCQPLED